MAEAEEEEGRELLWVSKIRRRRWGSKRVVNGGGGEAGGEGL